MKKLPIKPNFYAVITAESQQYVRSIGRIDLRPRVCNNELLFPEDVHEVNHILLSANNLPRIRRPGNLPILSYYRRTNA